MQVSLFSEKSGVMAQIRSGCISLSHCSLWGGLRTVQGAVNKARSTKIWCWGREGLWWTHTGLITMPTSVPKVLEKGMLPEVFYDSKMTSQMQVVRTNTCLRSKKKKPTNQPQNSICVVFREKSLTKVHCRLGRQFTSVLYPPVSPLLQICFWKHGICQI